MTRRTLLKGCAGLLFVSLAGCRDDAVVTDGMRDRRKKGKRIGRISQVLGPGYSYCGKCLTTWEYVHPRSVDLGNGHGCFALCEECWQESSITERLQYFHHAWERYWPHHEWEAIEAAVLKASGDGSGVGG